MNQIGLLIQRTFNGLTIEYSSSPEYQALSPSLFLTDERTMAMQLSPDTPVVSIAQDTRYKCYSFINATLDRERRSGFYAVRLFVEAGKELDHVTQHLMRITKAYAVGLEHQQPSHDYKNLLTEAQKDIKDSPYTLTETNIQKGNYYLAGAEGANLDAVFSNKEAAFVEKLYVFRKAIAPDHIQEFQLKPLNHISTKEVYIHDPVGHIKGSVYINGKKVNRYNLKGSNGTTLTMLASDKLSYEETSGGKQKEFVGKELVTREVTIKGPLDYIKALYINGQEVALSSHLTMLTSDVFSYQHIYDKQRHNFGGNVLAIKTLKVDNQEGQLEALWADNTPIPLKNKVQLVYALEGEAFYYKVKGGQRQKLPDGQATLLSPHKPAQKGATTSGVSSKERPMDWLLLILVALAGLLLGGIAGWYFTDKSEELAQKNQEIAELNKQLVAKDQEIKALQDLQAQKQETEAKAAADKEVAEKAKKEAEKAKEAAEKAKAKEVAEKAKEAAEKAKAKEAAEKAKKEAAEKAKKEAEKAKGKAKPAQKQGETKNK